MRKLFACQRRGLKQPKAQSKVKGEGSGGEETKGEEKEDDWGYYLHKKFRSKDLELEELEKKLKNKVAYLRFLKAKLAYETKF